MVAQSKKIVMEFAGVNLFMIALEYAAAKQREVAINLAEKMLKLIVLEFVGVKLELTTLVTA